MSISKCNSSVNRPIESCFNVSSTYLDLIWDVFRVLDGNVLRDLSVTRKVKKKLALRRKPDILTVIRAYLVGDGNALVVCHCLVVVGLVSQVEWSAVRVMGVLDHWSSVMVCTTMVSSADITDV
jgi:hypothetical protein